MNKIIKEIVLVFEDIKEHVKEEPIDGLLIAAALLCVLTLVTIIV